MKDFLLRELDRVGLPHNTFTPPAADLLVRAAARTVDIDIVNRVLMQPHWQKDADLAEY